MANSDLQYVSTLRLITKFRHLIDKVDLHSLIDRLRNYKKTNSHYYGMWIRKEITNGPLQYKLKIAALVNNISNHKNTKYTLSSFPTDLFTKEQVEYINVLKDYYFRNLLNQHLSLFEYAKYDGY